MKILTTGLLVSLLLISTAYADTGSLPIDGNLRKQNPIEFLELSEKQKEQLEQLRQEMRPVQSQPNRPQPDTAVISDEEVDLEFLLAMHANKNQEKNQRDQEVAKHKIAMQVKLQNILTPEQLETLNRLHKESSGKPYDA